MTTRKLTDDIIAAQFAKCGRPEPRRIPTALIPQTQKRLRAARGTGTHSSVKARRLQRLPMVLDLLGVFSLPIGIIVKATPDTPNRWESEYFSNCIFDPQYVRAEFQPFSLELASQCIYTPDIICRDRQGVIWCFEVKGFMREAARLRIRFAAKQFPQFRFVIVRKARGMWQHTVVEEISRRPGSTETDDMASG